MKHLLLLAASTIALGSGAALAEIWRVDFSANAPVVTAPAKIVPGPMWRVDFSANAPVVTAPPKVEAGAMWRVDFSANAPVVTP